MSDARQGLHRSGMMRTKCFLLISSGALCALAIMVGCGSSAMQMPSPGKLSGYASANTQIWKKAIAASAVPPTLANQSNTPQDVLSSMAGTKNGGFVTAGQTLGAYAGFANPTQNAEAVVARYDALGNQMWLVQCGSGSGDFLRGVTTDNAGSIYVAGTTDGTYSAQPNTVGSEALVAKFSPTGSRLWIQTFAVSSTSTSLSGIAVDSNGGIEVIGLATSASNGQDIAFAAQIDPLTGATGWIHRYGNFTTILNPTSIVAGLNGDVYVTGSNLSAVTPGLQTTADVSHLDATTGTQLWLSTFSSASEEYLLTCGAINSDGNPVFAGAASGKNSLIVGFGVDPSAHAYVTELDAKTGSAIWTTEPTTGTGDQITGLTALNSKLYVVGNTDGSFASAYKAQYDGDFLMRFAATGTVDWVQQFGTSVIVNLDTPAGVQVASDSTSIYVGSPSQANAKAPLTIELTGRGR